ncbi:hypothetical protein GA0115245_13811, partial [Streptomyces sp. di188]
MILLVGPGPGMGTATSDHRCVKTEEQLVAAGHSIDPARWEYTFEVLMDRIASRFRRVEPRRHAREFVLGLLAGLPRKNCWTPEDFSLDP